MKYIHAEMPVQAHLKNYFFWKENLDPKLAVELSYKTELRMVLLSVLKGKIRANTDGAFADRLDKKYSDTILCLVPTGKINRHMLWYTMPQISFFNQYLEKSFYEDLLYFVLLNKSVGINQKDTIYHFMDLLRIDHLIEYETVKKAVYRAKKLRKIPCFHVGFSPPASKPCNKKLSA